MQTSVNAVSRLIILAGNTLTDQESQCVMVSRGVIFMMRGGGMRILSAGRADAWFASVRPERAQFGTHLPVRGINGN